VDKPNATFAQLGSMRIAQGNRCNERDRGTWSDTVRSGLCLCLGLCPELYLYVYIQEYNVSFSVVVPKEQKNNDEAFLINWGNRIKVWLLVL
jgi:hypothetical protein